MQMQPAAGNGEEKQNRGARFLLILASLIIVLAGLKAAAGLIVPFLISGFLALISLPLLNWLQRRRVPTPLAVLLTLFVAVSILVGVAVIIGGSVRDFTADVPGYRARLEEMLSGILASLDQRGIRISREILDNLLNPGNFMDMLTGTLRGVAAVLSNLLLVFLTIVFILFEAAGFPEKMRLAFGHSDSSERVAKIRYEIQHYLEIKTLISLGTGVTVGLALALLGVDYALLWGTVAFLLNYVPNLGSIIAAVPPVILAALQHGAGRAIAVAVVFAVINIVLGNALEPYLMGRRLGLSTLVVFLSLVFWGWIWGPVGMLLSVPLTMILKIMLENTEDLRWIAILLGPGPSSVADEDGGGKSEPAARRG